MSLPPVDKVRTTMKLEVAVKELQQLRTLCKALPSHFIQAHDVPDAQGNQIESVNRGTVAHAIDTLLSELEYQERLLENRETLVSYLADNLLGEQFMAQTGSMHSRVAEFEAKYDEYWKLEFGPISYVSVLDKHGYDNGFQFFKSFNVFIELEDDAGIENVMLVLSDNSGLIDGVVDVNGFNHSYSSIKSIIFKDGRDVKIFKMTHGLGSDMNWEEFV